MAWPPEAFLTGDTAPDARGVVPVGIGEPEAAPRFTIDRLGHRGDGVAADAGGAPIFVARALPGEVIEGVPVAGRIAAPRILTPAPERVSAPCPHYSACGGCAVMHQRDDVTAAWKQGVVVQALAARGLVAPFRPMAISPPRSRRRATLSGRRLRRGALVGFHAARSEALVAVPRCHVLCAAIAAALPAFEAMTVAMGSRKAELSFIVAATETGLDVDIGPPRPLGAELQQVLAGIAAEAGIARLSCGGEVVAQLEVPRLRLGGMAVTPPPGAFLQATQEGEAALVAAVTEAVGQAGRIADLFAGCGTFALPLSRRAAVHAVEADAAMLEAAAAGWRSAGGPNRLTTEARDLFRRPLLAAELAHFDAVVIDPPRAGAAAQAARIAESAVPRVAAVSCDPATFARDAALLISGGYRLDWVQVIDQFRWSAHVELAAAFSRP